MFPVKWRPLVPQNFRLIHWHFVKGVANFRIFDLGAGWGGCKSKENPNFEAKAKVSDVKSVSGQKMHDVWLLSQYPLCVWAWIWFGAQQKPTKWQVHPAKTQISLHNCTVYSESTVSFMGRQGSKYMYEACSEIIETLAFYPEHIDIGKQNSASIIIDFL